jgi:hypothetical protein
MAEETFEDEESAEIEEQEPFAFIEDEPTQNEATQDEATQDEATIEEEE